MSPIIELWAEADNRRLQSFVAAADGDNLRGLLAHLDRGDEDEPRLAGLVERTAHAAAQDAEFAGALGLASRIAKVLLDEEGFVLKPDAPASHECNLHDLLRSGGGSHRSLAALWAHVCWNADYDAYWLEMGHFFPLCILEDGRPLLIDPASGAMLTRADCRQIVRELEDEELPFDEDLFERPHTRMVADIVLSTRSRGAEYEGDDVALYHAQRLRAALFPKEDRMQLNAALAAVEVGDFIWAQTTLRALRERCDDDELLTLIDDNLARLQDIRRDLN